MSGIVSVVMPVSDGSPAWEKFADQAIEHWFSGRASMTVEEAKVKAREALIEFAIEARTATMKSILNIFEEELKNRAKSIKLDGDVRA